MSTENIVALVKKQPIGFACGILCVIFAALLYFRSGAIAARVKENDEKSAESAKVLANVRNSSGLSDQVTEIQSLSKELEGRLVKASQLAVNLQYFYKLEAENGVKLLDVRQNSLPRNAKSQYVGVPYTVAIQGTYKQVLAFMQRLEAGRHFCRFNSVTFTKAGAAGEMAGGMTLNLNIQLLGQP